MEQFTEILSQWGGFMYSAGLLLGAVAVGLFLVSVLFRAARRLSEKTETELDSLIIKHARGPARLLIPLLTVRFFMPLIKMPEEALDFVNRALAVLMIIAIAFWDKNVCNLQVTNASERTMELRALVSAGDSSSAWNLRCEIREKLIKFIQEKYPEGLPRFRAEVQNGVWGSPPKQ